MKLAGALAILSIGLLRVGAARADGKVDFGRDILPLLSDNCFHCHGPDAKNRKAKLRLDDEQNVKKVREVIVPGKIEESELYRRLTATDPKEKMPPPRSNRKLTPGQIAQVKRWIEEGAPWGQHWALRPLSRPEVPRPTQYSAQVRNPIDAFVLARLESEGLSPAPAAPRETLIRRLSLDLTGLPPTPEEVEAFLRDPAPDAYERLVERLLASPGFGERLAWDWLDAARYADSNGYQGDNDRTMWPWRDWVVAAFNRNLPYDQFTIWQLAGDLLPSATAEQKLATAFCRNHMINGEGGRIPEENRVDYVMDMAETMGTVWLGLTFNCCRCHDHKYDPLTRRDYYRLFAFFNQTPVDGSGGNPQTPPVLEVVSESQRTHLAELANKVRRLAEELDRFEQSAFPQPMGKSADQSAKAAALPAAIRAILKSAASRRSTEQLSLLEKQRIAPDHVARVRKLRAAVTERDKFSRSLPRVMVMEDMARLRPTFMLDKGLYDKPGEQVAAGVPASLPPLPHGVAPNRLGLARWLVAPDNPLTARVTVNRFWQMFFGTGLVKTPGDFGVQGEKPSHPELLDWLAADFVASGWDVKRLCHLLVTSATYRQASKVPPGMQERDPENRLLARGSRYRLPSWMIRDQALAASGLLALQVGGPSVKPYQPAGVWEEATFGMKQYRPDKGAALHRRSLYTFWRRIIGPTLFFDSASRQVCTVKQPRTNTPLHALATLNDVTYLEAARNLAERVLTTAAPPERVEVAFRLVLARRPTAEEARVLQASVDRLRGEFTRDPRAAQKLLSAGETRRNGMLDPAEHAAYTVLASTILNLDEALTRE
jgi:hypothetical protein